MALHPNDVLFAGSHALPAIPAVDHYAGAERFLRRALAMQADLGPLFDITFDCEDGAPAGGEADHARMGAQIIASKDNRFDRVGLRCHDVTHPHWQVDLDIALSICGDRLAFVTLPKARDLEDVLFARHVLRGLEQRYNTKRHIPLHVIIETHGAVRDVWSIAALEGVESLDFGLMDFVSEHRGAIPSSALRSPAQFEHPLIVRAKTEVAAAAHAYGRIPSHNVSTILDDANAVFEDAHTARERFGFLRMWSIHPGQIEPILRAMRPDAADVADAAGILLAAQAQHWGPIRFEGRLHDRGSYRYYWHVLLRARRTGMPLPAAADTAFFGPRNAEESAS
ncbi:CoA ester lyase [Uliginosibacterium sp. sgz301328]|uniref:HpcH/HpaI aldolase/citrate lyase family protein n=1 Tax=Uliginosibacterium sp. sgz301328 TaxID=3243764 RepID=UPI00359D0886